MNFGHHVVWTWRGVKQEGGWGTGHERVHHSVTIMPSIRRATADDAEACHGVMWTAVTDLGARRGTPLVGSAAEWWASGESLQRFLASRAAEWWVAEQDSRIVGYCRSIESQGLFELTEFLVLPMTQAKGVGRVLLERAFPSRRIQIRSIIATTDERALSRYYAAGTALRFPILALSGLPQREQERRGLTPAPRTPGGARNRARDPGVGARRGRDSLAARRSRGVPLRARRTQLASPSSESAARARSPL